MAAAARDLRGEARAEADGVGRELLGAPHLRAEARFVAVVGDEVEDHLSPHQYRAQRRKAVA